MSAISLNVTLNLPGVNDRLDQLITLFTAYLAEEKKMDAATQAAFDTLNANVAQQTTLEGSLETLLNGLTAKIAADAAAAGATPEVLAAIKAASDGVAANNAKTAAALVANTPAA